MITHEDYEQLFALSTKIQRQVQEIGELDC